MNNENANVPLATPGSYRIYFSWPSADVSGRQLDDILDQIAGGPAALLDMFNWKKLETVQPGAKRYLEAFFLQDRVRTKLEPIAREKRAARSKAIRRNRKGRVGPTNADQEKRELFGL